ncbi:MAG: hypothetical protein KME49_07285 [Brasilonema octagenarum HA4186-MV1]|jgi:hypothetical protein|nr:hypothetical protein [Brasilonema octagenarum HA4186-MV1]
MIQLLANMGLGLVGGVAAGPLGGAAGYVLSDFIFDEEKEYLESEELVKKYAVKFVILAAGGSIAGFAGEALGRSVGASLDGISEMFIPGDISNQVADLLLSNETLANLFNELCNLTANSCLSEEAKAGLITTYFDKFEAIIYYLINDEIMEEMVGREIVKPLANKYAQNWLAELKSNLGYA